MKLQVARNLPRSWSQHSCRSRTLPLTNRGSWVAVEAVMRSQLALPNTPHSNRSEQGTTDPGVPAKSSTLTSRTS